MKREPRLLHVSCVVREDGEVWALLRALEACSAGAVEVKPVGGDIPVHIAAHMGFKVNVEPEQEQIPPPPPSQNGVIARYALPAPMKKKRRVSKRTPDGHTKREILKTMQHHVPMQIGDIVRATGFSRSAVHVAMHEMNKLGWVERQKMGVYVRANVPAGLVP